MRLPFRAIVLLFALPACTLGGPEPVPLRGDVPDTIAVWPLVAEPHEPARDLLLAGLDVALGTRGYQLVAWPVGERLLADAGLLAPDADLTRVGTTLRADAVLTLYVRDFEASGQRPLEHARWDLEWRLTSTRGRGVLWSYEHHGSWRPSQALDDPYRAPDTEPDVVPIGGNRKPAFRDAVDLISWLHRMAMSHLPPRGR